MSTPGAILELHGARDTGYLVRWLTATGTVTGLLALVQRPTLVWLDTWVQMGYRIHDCTHEQQRS